MIYSLTLNPALDRELTVPDLLSNEVLRAIQVRVHCGGKGFNVSRALAALGAESIALGIVGGTTGERLEVELESLGIRTDFLHIADETRTNISIVTEDHSHYIKVNEPGPTITRAEEDALVQKIQALAQQGDWWVLSGSLPPGASATIYASMIREVQSAGARAMLDTSGDPLRYGCEAGPFLVKPSASEASNLIAMDIASIGEARAAAPRIHALGVEIVVISLGRDGALLSEGGRAWMAEPPPIEEHNPIGAGDALLAGLVWAMSKDFSLPEVLRWGVACGAAAASLNGTAMGSRTLVMDLSQQVRLRPC